MSNSKRIFSVHRSDTHLGLPEISSLYPRQHRTINRSHLHDRSYLNDISEMAGLNSTIDYAVRQPKYLRKEHTNLKKVLSKINSDTLKLVNEIKPKVVIDNAAVAIVKDKQIISSFKMIQNFRKEISKLQEKLETIVRIESTRDLHADIAAVRSEIDLMKTQNYDNHLQIRRQGNQIVETYAEVYPNLLNRLHVDVQIGEEKLSKLKSDSLRVSEEIEKIKKKLIQMDPAFKEAEAYLLQHKEEADQQAKNISEEGMYRYKLAHFQHLKKKAATSHFQFRYYKALKLVQQVGSNCILAEEKTVIIQGEIENKEKVLLALEKVYEDIKRTKQQNIMRAIEFVKQVRIHQQEETDKIDVPAQVILETEGEKLLNPENIEVGEAVQTTNKTIQN